MLIELATEKDSENMAARLANGLISPVVLTFSGDIGVGKTTIIRAMIRCLGIKSAIKSPTFSLVESYNAVDFSIHHFDLYRICHENELDDIGFSDYFTKDAVCFIEWPERVKSCERLTDVSFALRLKGEGREMDVSAYTATGEALLSSLRGKS